MTEKNPTLYGKAPEKTLFVPMMAEGSLFTPGAREKLLDALKKADADVLLLAVDRAEFFKTAEERRPYLDKVAESVRFFRAAGLTVGVWTQVLGFGDRLDDVPYTELTSAEGKTMHGDAFCPEDERFVAAFCGTVRELCECAPDILLLDDDYTLSVRPGFDCFCPLHRKKLARRLPIFADAPWEEWQKLLFTGKNPDARKIFRETEAECLYSLAERVRKTVDSVDPAIRCGLCSGYVSFGYEGADVRRLTKILAGNTRPLLRLSGAPYWSRACGNAKRFSRFGGPGAVTEFVRSQADFLAEDPALSDLQLLSEGDVYPRPRTQVPASLLESNDLSLTASGGISSFKYLFDYYALPDYEKGYLREHARHAGFRAKIAGAFGAAKDVGVRVAKLDPDRWLFADLPPFTDGKSILYSAFSPAVSLLTANGFSVTRGDSACAVLCGEEARRADGSFFADGRKIVLDIPAVKILAERAGGAVDLGLLSADEASFAFENFGEERTFTDDRLTFPAQRPPFFRCAFSGDVTVLSTFSDGREVYPASVLIKRGKTEYLVLCADLSLLSSRSGYVTSYFRQKQLADFFGSAYAVPHMTGEPYQYVLAREKREDGKRRLSVLYVNYSDDFLDGAILRAGENYVSASAFDDCHDLSLEETDGGYRVAERIPPYGVFVAVFDCKD